MSDPTELPRRARIAELASEVAEPDPRAALEARYGKVYDTAEMSAEFDVLGFMAPYVVVTRKSDGVKGSLEFSHRPRFYFNFVPDNG
jgi:hypothetical protein